ncbi:eukaryotic translation initiation factor 5B [Rhineura floridana]|uniref:eukaryotic translation initiation factor 5B n=1 Tax=Rhineura floridana TaxID=261503 RepID=UPI002AC88097|nr:eukaryotic translation initiation factor 5B [Rhineura floridana]
MGKKQKNKSEESAKDDIDLDALAAEIEGAGAAREQEPQKSKAKKKKEKKKQEYDEEDILKELEELSLETQGGKVEREPASIKSENDNEEFSFSKQDKKKKGKNRKSILEEEDSEEMEDKDKKSKKAPKPPKEAPSGSDDDDDDFDILLKKKKGKAPKPNRKQELSEEDEAVVARKSKERTQAGSSGESGDELDEGSESKKGQKKNQKAKPVAEAESGDEEVDSSFKIKTVAQKKAEKKERERKKREEEKAKLRKQKEKEDLEANKEHGKQKEVLKKAEKETTSESVPASTTVEKGETSVVAEGDDNEGEKKKKEKDKKKKKGEKEEKEKKKGPSKATVKAMQEALAKLKEEEERAKREEEERIRRLEELEAKRKEEERLEQERKERKKQKEKERKERLKKEGKLLTKSQREARARAEATLKLLQAQGVEVPSKDSVPKKRPIYEDKKKKKQQQQQENKEEIMELTSPTEEAVEPVTSVKEAITLPAEPVSEEKEEDEPEDTGLDDWEAMVSDEEREKERKTVHIEVKEQNDADDDGEEEEEEEEESEEYEDGESEGSEGEDEKTSDEREVEPQAAGKPSVEKRLNKELSSDSEYDSDEDRTKEERCYDKAKRRIEKRRTENNKNINIEKLRAPVICVLGHVDTGKTKILDKLRHTHVQDSEAGGITQQIGATNVPLEAINEQAKMVKTFDRETVKIPGMLIIDTPGHESFSNLRNRGSSLCDIAILVVDIMHGLEPQTIESINLLKSKKCPFIVALNKIDRLYDWKKSPDTDVAATLKKQKKNTKDEFEERAKAIIVEFAQQGLNAALFYENKDPRTFVSLVPTSAHTGDGMGSLIALLVDLTQTMLSKRLAHCEELRAQVMEVKALPGMGTTIDVILINGRLREGDTIIVPGVEGPIVTQIRGLLLPPPMKELRVKNQYEKHKEVIAAQGVKILGKDLEKTLAGLPLLVACKEDEIPVLKDELVHELKQTLNAIKLEEKGVYVQASTLGSLEALLEFLKTSEVPYAGINIGPVHKKDVMKASVMLEHDPQYAVILAFDVRIERDAQEMADSLGVRIFSAEIIYHLFDAFTKYRQDYKKQKQEEFKHIAVFPCKMKILPQFIFNSRDPIVMGVIVEAGQVKQGTPLCVPSKNFIDIGIVTSIEINHKQVDVAKKGQEVCVKIEPIPGEAPKMFGRHFEATDILVSKISRQSIDALKDWFRDEMQKSDWQLIVELKKVFEII